MLQTVIRTLILYFVVIVAIRFMGKRQIGDLQPSELVITILISEIAAMPIQDSEIPLHYGIIATFLLVALEIATSFAAMKSPTVRRILYGRSAIIIENGIIDQVMLRKLRVTVPDLMEVLRNQEVFDISEVAYAILETNGQMSVLLKPEHMTATVNDLNGKHGNSSMPCLVVSDGKLLNDAMKHFGISKVLVNAELRKRKLGLKDIFIMTVDSEGNCTVVKKANTRHYDVP